MSLVGINASADARIAPEACRAINAGIVRVVLQARFDLTDWMHQAHACGLQVLGIIARESLVPLHGPEYVSPPRMPYREWLESIRTATGVVTQSAPLPSGAMPYSEACQFYADRYGTLLNYVQPGNESDHFIGDSSWGMTPEDLNDLLAAANGAFPSNVPIVGPGLVSGHPAYLDSVNLDLLDSISVHPYGQAPGNTVDWGELPGNFGNVNDLLDSYVYHGKPIWITEFGVSTTECSEDFQARYLSEMFASLGMRSDVPSFSWFAHDDNMVPEFGLYRTDGSAKPAAAAFTTAANEEGEPVMPPTDSYTVGDGLRQMMTEDGTTPITSSSWLPLGQTPSSVEESQGANGTIYRWALDLGQGFRYAPS